MDSFISVIMTICVAYAQPKLQCNGNNSFRIVQFTDLHFGESNIGDYMTTSLMNIILDTEKPDLVVLSGDIVSGYTWNGKEGWFRRLWDTIVQPMINHNIAWVFTPGNHEAEGDWNRSQIIQNDIRYADKGSFTQKGYMDPKTDQNIYNVPVYNNANNSICNIWMIDSGMKDCNDDYDYFGCLQPSQMEWFAQQDHSVPGIIYMHIPSAQLITYYESNAYPMIGEWFANKLFCLDETHLRSDGKQSVMDYVSLNDDIFAMFHGHEHVYDSVILYENDLLIGFGRKGGEGWMIGVDNGFSMISGARVFEFECDNPRIWSTWIRDKYLNIVDATTLHDMQRQKETVQCEETAPRVKNDVECSKAHYWKGWKRSVLLQFKHWITPWIIDIIDIVCRVRLVHFINDYVYDLDMNNIHEI